MKPTIAIVHGPMAAGKSTVTRELDENLKDFIFVDRAYIKNVMLAKLDDRELAKELSQDAVNLIMTGLMKLKKNMLLQETRAPSIKKSWRKEIKKYGYNVKSFYLHCTLETAQLRDIQRQKRHIRPEVVREMHRRHGYADTDDLVIDTDSFSVKQTVNKILKELRR
ncbi:AAA family ATPase [Candidatus Woesearchaeota archaeon]|nr:AAA family ATPase [Candidatus Woesearchaeota archaeon]